LFFPLSSLFQIALSKPFVYLCKFAAVDTWYLQATQYENIQKGMKFSC